MNFYKGEIFSIDKPYGMTSFGALAHIRYVLSRRLKIKRVKIGHAGTLDPLATGVLILCTGKATKQIEQLQSHTKEYTCTIQLGATTESYDREHTVNATYPTNHITLDRIEEILKQFIGDIRQTPPTYSACKVGGERAYALRRSGEAVVLKPKTVRIDTIETIGFDRAKMQLNLRIVCGKGTYIRALARDIGRALGSGAFLLSLRRTKVGSASVENSINFDRFEEWLNQQEIEEDQQ